MPEDDVIRDPEEAARQALRSEHNVRPLRALEEGFGLDMLPGGIYGFAYSPAYEDAPLFRERCRQAFEVHKLRDGTTVLLGYVSPDVATSMENVRLEQHVFLYPCASEKAARLVAIPRSRVARYKDYDPDRSPSMEIMLVSEQESGRGATPPSFRLENTFQSASRA